MTTNFVALSAFESVHRPIWSLGTDAYNETKPSAGNQDVLTFMISSISVILRVIEREILLR